MADPVVKSVRRKMSVVTISGFKCSTCGTETVTHDGSTAMFCLDCGAKDPKLAWKNIVKDTSEVEIVAF